MSRVHVGHSQIADFADNRVNLPAEKARVYRKQARGLRERLESHLSDNPDFALKKMLLSGSLAKGTALRSINDIDVAVYVSGSDAPRDIADLLRFIAERLVLAYPNVTREQVRPNTYSVTISFRSTGLDVDVVPILYHGDAEWRGDLVSQDDGSFLETSIPLHLDFMRKRKKRSPDHYAQVIRLVKYWAGRMKKEVPGFRFKSFMIELIMAKLCDDGVDFSDYPEALQSFFTYLATSRVRERIAFTDFSSAGAAMSADSDIVKIIDPVNGQNNVGKLYTSTNADLIADKALEAGDAIDWALSAPTKQDTVAAWQDVFGSTFQG